MRIYNIQGNDDEWVMVICIGLKENYFVQTNGVHAVSEESLGRREVGILFGGLRECGAGIHSVAESVQR